MKVTGNLVVEGVVVVRVLEVRRRLRQQALIETSDADGRPMRTWLAVGDTLNVQVNVSAGVNEPSPRDPGKPRR